MEKYKLQPGNELRGFKIRLYPSKDTEEKMLSLEKDMRRAWNWLVTQTEEVLRARQAVAIRNGFVSAKPAQPIYDGLTPEESKALKEKHIKTVVAWHETVHTKTNKLPGCKYRSVKELVAHFAPKIDGQKQHDYQMLQRVIAWPYEENNEKPLIKPGAHALQSLVKNYFTKGKNQRRKKFRKASDAMPLQTRSGKCFELGDYGLRRGKQFYNCQIKFNGLKIPGRLPGKIPEGRILEGVSIIKEADGWYASIKQEVPIRVIPDAIVGTIIGIDVGLDNIAAMSAPKDNPIPKDIQSSIKSRIQNARGKQYVERIAGRQTLKLPVGRLQCAAARHMRHVIFNEIIKPLGVIEIIKVEKLGSKIGQMGSSKGSVMRLIVQLLKERYGSRVREVEPHYTSQDCSQCGHRSKESWSYEHGRYGECPKCNYRADRDVNAARNIAAKPLESLVA